MNLEKDLADMLRRAYEGEESGRVEAAKKLAYSCFLDRHFSALIAVQKAIVEQATLSGLGHAERRNQREVWEDFLFALDLPDRFLACQTLDEAHELHHKCLVMKWPGSLKGKPHKELRELFAKMNPTETTDE